MAGRLFLVVGPSGVGKDTLLSGARSVLSGDDRFVFPRRIITRPEGDAAEDHIAVSDDEFASMEQAGAFLVAWRAHGLSYAIKVALADDLAAGRHGVVNVSRKIVGDLATRHQTTVLSVTADPSTLRARLLARGREDAEDVATRLAREAPFPADGLDLVTIKNDGPAADGIAAMVAALTTRAGAAQPVS